MESLLAQAVEVGEVCLRGTQEGNEKVERAEHASCTLKRDRSKGENRG